MHKNNKKYSKASLFYCNLKRSVGKVTTVLPSVYVLPWLYTILYYTIWVYYNKIPLYCILLFWWSYMPLWWVSDIFCLRIMFCHVSSRKANTIIGCPIIMSTWIQKTEWLCNDIIHPWHCRTMIITRSLSLQWSIGMMKELCWYNLFIWRRDL